MAKIDSGLVKKYYYPILIPSVLHEHDEAYKTYTPKLKFVPEKEDFEPPTPNSVGCLLWIILEGLALSIASIGGDGTPMAIGMLSATVVIPLIYIVSSNSNKKNNLLALEKAKSVFNQKVRTRNSIVRENDAIIDYFLNLYDGPRQLALEKIYEDIGATAKEGVNFKEGASEKIFYNNLKQSRLSAYISKGFVVTHETISYYPDIAIIDCSNNIYIDIEIDEPYEFSERLPIHLVGDDDNRNEFFRNIGWTVIRFSERQIVTQCELVIKCIIAVYDDLISGRVPELKHGLEIEECWDEGSAKKMEALRVRESYLYKK